MVKSKEFRFGCGMQSAGYPKAEAVHLEPSGSGGDNARHEKSTMSGITLPKCSLLSRHCKH